MHNKLNCVVFAALWMVGAGSALAQDAAPSSEDRGVHIIVRRDFVDMWLFDDPTPRAAAEGAEFSYLHDGIADDDSWSAQGMVAVPFSIEGAYGSVLGFSLAPYLEFDRQSHSNDEAETNLLTGGFSGEIGFDSLGGANFFRTRFAATSDDVNDVTSVNVVGEWLPVYDSVCVGYPCSIPGVPIIFRFQPELIAEYSKTIGGDGTLPFSGQDESFLLGPQLTLVLKAFGAPIPLLDKLSGSVTYSWARELYSGTDYDWLAARLTYNLDKEGYLGVSVGYENGNRAKTAEEVDQFTIALTGKL